VIFKKLEKKMTYDEVLSYIRSHPKWRLPSLAESGKIGVHDIHFVEGEPDSISSGSTVAKIVPCSNGCMEHENIKKTVVLVPYLENIKTGTIFYCTVNNSLYSEAVMHFGTEYLTYVMAKYVNKVYDDDSLKKVVKAMTNKDIIKIRKG